MLSGDLQSVDGYMNIALERCKEVVEDKVVRNWGDAFIRGNNGIHLFVFEMRSSNLSHSHIHLCRQRMIPFPHLTLDYFSLAGVPSNICLPTAVMYHDITSIACKYSDQVA